MNDRWENSQYIESPKNERLKSVARLRENRGRKRAGQFLIDGVRENLRAMQCGEKIQSVFLCSDQLQTEAQAAMETWAQHNGIPCWWLSPAAFEKISFGQRHEGVVSVAQEVPHPLTELPDPTGGLLLVVESIEKPGNLGALFRTADAAGVTSIIVANPLADPKNHNAIRASLGTVFSLPYALATSAQVLAWLQEKQAKIFAARVDAELDYVSTDFSSHSDPVAVVLGSEADGLGPIWKTPTVQATKITMAGIADSLNISVAAAVILFEVVRQRKLAPK